MQRALRYFGLIGGVAGEKLGARNEVWHDRRRVMVVHAAAGKHRQLLVLFAQVAKEVSYFYFALSTGQVVVASEAYFFGHLCKERV